MQYTAFIMSGSSEKDSQDPLLLKAGVKNKAFINLNGTHMIDYVLDAINGSKYIKSIFIAGLEPSELNYKSEKPMDFLKTEGDRLNTVFRGMEYLSEKQDPNDIVILFSSDIPLINSEIIDDCIEQMNIEETKKDVYYGMVPKRIFDERFPHAHRHFRKFKEDTLAGGDLHAFRIKTILENEEATRKLMANPKSLAKTVFLFSPLFVLQYAIGRLSIYKIHKFFHNNFNTETTHYDIRYPEAGMDLDYPDQLEEFSELLKTQA